MKPLMTWPTSLFEEIPSEKAMDSPMGPSALSNTSSTVAAQSFINETCWVLKRWEAATYVEDAQIDILRYLRPSIRYRVIQINI